MATITLTADTNYSALAVANDDTIELAGNRLTIDVQPNETGVDVVTPGTPGTCTLGGAWDLSTWEFTAGAGTLFNILPFGSIVGSLRGGDGNVARGCNNALGKINTVYGGSGNSALGVLTNRGEVGMAAGGPAPGTAAVHINYGTVGSATGGAHNTSDGVSTNYGVVLFAESGSVADSHGVQTGSGQVLSGTDGVVRAIGSMSGQVKFVDGPRFAAEIVTEDDPLQTLYVLNGPLNANAVIPPGVTIIEAFGAGGGTAGPTNVFLSGVFG